ncbi:solute carrier organic anion transporter family member 2A1 isoform X2 [Patella vulgata]|uniref:solute carrier organic anion transporter family member 2A1 isoform X2 n=1 Tax=Patella vulgata TaxID=6465 RepID=UPI00217F6E5A|nr:solute carrier organic anion transporter family member 2A1 isoform X2 [Patella vulgata]
METEGIPLRGLENRQQREDGQATTSQIDAKKPEQDVEVLSTTFPIGLKWFIVFHSVSVVTVNAILAYTVSQITAIERHFGFTSSQSGIVVASIDIGFISTSLFVGYFATRVHIPRALATSTFVFGATALLCSLPNFIFSRHQHTYTNTSTEGPNLIGPLCLEVNQSTTEKCSSNFEDDNTASFSDSDHLPPFCILVISGILQGIFLASRYPFLVSYLESNTDKSKTGFNLGIIGFFTILGPAVGFGLGGVFGTYHITLHDVDITPRHSAWIGAWWLGYVVFGVLSLIAGVPMLFSKRSYKNQQMLKDQSYEQQRKLSLLKHFKALISVIWQLLKNPVFTLVEVGTCTFLFVMAGTGAFYPKYLETQFLLPAWQVNIIIGGTTMATSAIGTMTGGWITSFKSMTPLRNLIYVTVTTFLSGCLESCGFLFSCQWADQINTVGKGVSDGCYDTCGCDASYYSPVCGDDINYLSPCYAGCTSNNDTSYLNCGCIESGSATTGLCEADCSQIYLYVVTKALAALLGSSGMIPYVMVIIRCVTEEQKPMAMGVAAFINALAGWLLGPIVYGKLVDHLCLVWNSCQVGGASCALYDQDKFRYLINGSMAAGNFTFTLFSTIAIFCLIRRDRIEEKGEL